MSIQPVVVSHDTCASTKPAAVGILSQLATPCTAHADPTVTPLLPARATYCRAPTKVPSRHWKGLCMRSGPLPTTWSCAGATPLNG